MTAALRSFMDELRAAPVVRKAVAAGTVINGVPVERHLGDLEGMIRHVETADTELAIKVFDGASEIVGRDGSLQARLLALLEFLKDNDPRPRRQ